MTYKLSNGSILQLLVRDTQGQERYRNLWTKYYKKADCCLLVYSIQDHGSFEECKNYFKDKIKDLCKKDIKVALCGNMTDIEYKRQVSYEEAFEFELKIIFFLWKLLVRK